MWQNLRLETFASLLESIVIFKIAFDSFFFPLYGYRFGFMFVSFILFKLLYVVLIKLLMHVALSPLSFNLLLRFGNGWLKKNTDIFIAVPEFYR